MKSAAIVVWVFPPGSVGGHPIVAVSNEGIGGAMRDYEEFMRCRESALSVALIEALAGRPPV